MWFTHIDSQINKLLSVARFTRYSGRSSFGRVDYYSQAGKHRFDHYQCLHTPSKLLHWSIHSIPGSSDDDDDALILEDFNAHHSSWYSSSTDSRGTMLESMMTTDYNKTDGHSPTTRNMTGHNLRKTQSPLSLGAPYPPIYTLPT